MTTDEQQDLLRPVLEAIAHSDALQEQRSAQLGQQISALRSDFETLRGGMPDQYVPRREIGEMRAADRVVVSDHHARLVALETWREEQTRRLYESQLGLVREINTGIRQTDAHVADVALSAATDMGRAASAANQRNSVRRFELNTAMIGWIVAILAVVLEMASNHINLTLR